MRPSPPLRTAVVLSAVTLPLAGPALPATGAGVVPVGCDGLGVR